MRRENKVFGRRERGARKRIWGEGMRCKNKVFGGRERGARKKNSGVGNEEQETSIWGERMGRKKSIWGKGMRHEKKFWGGGREITSLTTQQNKKMRRTAE